ncbi:MAG: hypothetical protein H6550_14410 [Chitinophagales bacterium]|nr:hypothetical protein [Chitinophagales bacterium]
MKKVFLLLMICFTTVIGQANAIGLSIIIAKGILEIDPYTHAYSCVGPKHICNIMIRMDWSLSSTADAGLLQAGEGGVFNNNGSLTIALPASTLTDPNWNQVFVGNFLSLSADYYFTPQEQAALGANCPAMIPAGNYPYVIQNNVVVIAI